MDPDIRVAVRHGAAQIFSLFFIFICSCFDYYSIDSFLFLFFFELVQLTASIKLRLTPQPVRIRADIEVTCFTYERHNAIKNKKTTTIVYVCSYAWTIMNRYEGIDAIKEALTAGVAKETPEMNIKVCDQKNTKLLFNIDRQKYNKQIDNEKNCSHCVICIVFVLAA